MNLRDFEYLVAIDEQKSFSKAARKAFISQPALSQQVQKIEAQLAVKIFERGRNNIITTAKGQEIIATAREILALYNRLKTVGTKEDQLKIGLIPTICPYLLPLVVDRLKSQLPKVKFYFLELKTKDLLSKIRSGEIDAAILVYFEDLFDDKLFYKKLYREEFLLTTPRNYKASFDLKKTLSDNDFEQILSSKNLILLEEGNCMSDNIKEICSVYNQDAFNDFYATNIETVKNMVRMNNGLALLPELACSKDSRLRFVPFKNKKYREVVMVMRKNYAAKAMLENVGKIITQATK